MSKDDRACIEFEEGSGNVFADLGLDDADELFARAQLGFHVYKLVAARKLKQRDAASLLGIKQPEGLLLPALRKARRLGILDAKGELDGFRHKRVRERLAVHPLHHRLTNSDARVYLRTVFLTGVDRSFFWGGHRNVPKRIN